MFIVGAGGLGCPAVLELVGRGVSPLAIADFDRVEETNLPRQLIYAEKDIGRLKVDVVAEKVAGLPGGPELDFRTFVRRIRGDESFLDDFAVVIDATDRAEMKLALHDKIVTRGISFIHAAASAWSGQALSVQGPGCLRCLFGDEPGLNVPDCATAGIVGPVVGFMGAAAADEAFRIATGEKPKWSRRFFSVDFLSGRSRFLPFEPVPGCRTCAKNGE